jgi:predicted PurR-regulated permease PerM
MGTVRRIGTSLGAYIKAVALNAVIVSLLFVVGFAVAGVPWWLLVGLLCGLLNAVPQIGGLLSLTLVMLVTLFFTPGWTTMALAGTAWVVVQGIEGFVLAPRAAGRSGVPPIFSIFLVLAVGILLGPIAAILAVPVAAVVLIIWRTARGRDRS